MIKNIYLRNTKKALGSQQAIVGGFFAMLVVALIGIKFMNFNLIAGNLGINFAYAELILLILLGIFFGFFVMLTIYKMVYFHRMGGKQTTTGTVGGILGVLVVGCPACSITLASYVGLASLFSLLPYHGLELKVIGVGLLAYAIASSLKTLEVCSMRRKK